MWQFLYVEAKNRAKIASGNDKKQKSRSDIGKHVNRPQIQCFLILPQKL
jgi:hypothetical protein